MSHSTDDDWEKLGEVDPYWAVLSQDANRRAVLTDDARRRFYQGGEDYLDRLWRLCRREFGDDFAPARALDFGCGVGRVTIPLARRCASVVAADVATSMLREARKALEEQRVENVELLQSDDALQGIEGPFDFVHSLLVFQHVPSPRGLKLIDRLLDVAGPEGTIALHVLFYNPHERPPLERRVRGIARALLRPFRSRPRVEMHPYPMNDVLRILHRRGFRDLHLEFTEHAGHLGVTCMGRLSGASRGGP